MDLRRRLAQLWLNLTMRSSRGYWERRYQLGLTSGSGSEGVLARYKAEVLNEFVARHGIARVVEFGCGDGQQLALAHYPRYLGIDVSPTAVELCRTRFAAQPGREFRLADPAQPTSLGEFAQPDLVLSLDVIYHLVEDATYQRYLREVFGAGGRHVIVYSSNDDRPAPVKHVRHRRFVDDVAREFPGYRLVGYQPNPHRELSFAEFHFYERTG